MAGPGHRESEVEEGAKDALKLDGQGRYDDALHRAKVLAEKHTNSAQVWNLLGFLHRQSATRAGDAISAKGRYEESLSAYSEAARLAPNCVLTAVAHGAALSDCQHYAEAMAELRRAHEIADADDPAPYYVGTEITKFGYHERNTKSSRTSNAVNALAKATQKLRAEIESKFICGEMNQLLSLSTNEAVTALERAKLLAKEWPISGRARLLVARLQLQHDFITDPGDSKAAILRRAVSTIEELEQEFPKSLVIPLIHATLLHELYDSDAVIKCCQALSKEDPDDPIDQAIPYDFFSGMSSTERVADAKSKIKNLHKQIITEARQFWRSFGLKDAVTAVTVGDLAHYAKCFGKDSDQTIYHACTFFKEHGQWDFLTYVYAGSYNTLHTSYGSFQLEFRVREGFQRLMEALGENLYALEAMRSSCLDQIIYVQDPAQHDSLRSENVEGILDLMLCQSDPEVKFESNVKKEKGMNAMKISWTIQDKLRTLPEDKRSPKYKKCCLEIQELWARALDNMYFDYREFILPLLRKFQWMRLKSCMADANTKRNLKQPLSVFILQPFCSRCWERGHTVSACKLCIICGSETHETSNCPTSRYPSPVAQLVGCAASGQEFYAGTQPGLQHAIAKIIVESGRVTVDQLTQEFAEKFECQWKWAAKEHGPQEFLMKFPNVDRIEELSKSSITLEKTGAQVRVHKRATGVVPKAKLSLVWITVKGVPDGRKNLACLQEVGSMIGYVKHVDLEMLEEYDVVRMKVYVKDHEKIPPCKEYAYEGDIYDIYFCVDSVIEYGFTYKHEDNGKGGNQSTENHSRDLEPLDTEVRDDRSRIYPDSTSGNTEFRDTLPNDSGKKVLVEAMDNKTKNQAEEHTEVSKKVKCEMKSRLPEASGDKNVEGQVNSQSTDYGKGASVKIQPSAMYGSSRQPSPASLMRPKKSPPPEHVVLGKVVSLSEINLFAYHCKAVKNRKDGYTICHVCTFEGVSDIPVKLREYGVHMRRRHPQPGMFYECEECFTKARTCADIRRHYYFAHYLPKGWWREFLEE